MWTWWANHHPTPATVHTVHQIKAAEAVLDRVLVAARMRFRSSSEIGMVCVLARRRARIVCLRARPPVPVTISIPSPNSAPPTMVDPSMALSTLSL